jgi:hypothetical protein
VASEGVAVGAAEATTASGTTGTDVDPDDDVRAAAGAERVADGERITSA